ncbi:hypothetical protein M378DRAFT_190092 [Amanita muscaria Koide BX008]|uniref:DNA primase large subunit n=1 Tax=Amanita muscaria (strain Koide BX008) TaxID=946122 RepID=A0A0C2XKR9_AMAMK|nr:hypothetical protein M378DRAFT_190092 [Amanita muscaria Koide BX008]
MHRARERRNVSKGDYNVSKDNDGASTYPHRLNFYDRPPMSDVTVEEFETSALDRLRVLTEIESSAARNRTWDETKRVIDSLCKKHLPLGPNPPNLKDEQWIRDTERRKDHLSHFVLRLAFCRSEDLRRRFVKAETTLFRIRYETDLVDDRYQFLDSRQLDRTVASEEEKKEYKEDLISLHFSGPEDNTTKELWFKAARFYKVRWTRVPDLVERRSILLKGGWAYVPENAQASIIYDEFETRLVKALEVTNRALPRLDEDTRLLPILENLSKGFVAGVSSEVYDPSNQSNGDIKAEMVDELARQHFPLCMRTLHENLRRDSHLKHFGRLNYGLFLKVLGLSIEEAVVFWRKAFNKMTDDKFNKEHKYNIRHSYGLEGKRANYPAKSCVQLLTCAPSEPGCPYRQYSPENLSSALLQYYSGQGLTSADLPEILGTVKGGHCHVACTRVFEITHGKRVKRGEGMGEGESVTHPNQYAAKSIEMS